jgi:hypothetical protein
MLLVGDQHQLMQPPGLCRVAVVTIATTELIELVVQISDGVVSN